MAWNYFEHIVIASKIMEDKWCHSWENKVFHAIDFYSGTGYATSAASSNTSYTWLDTSLPSSTPITNSEQLQIKLGEIQITWLQMTP